MFRSCPGPRHSWWLSWRNCYSISLSLSGVSRFVGQIRQYAPPPPSTNTDLDTWPCAVSIAKFMGERWAFLFRSQNPSSQVSISCPFLPMVPRLTPWVVGYSGERGLSDMALLFQGRRWLPSLAQMKPFLSQIPQPSH